MPFNQGEYFAIQGRMRHGGWTFLEVQKDTPLGGFRPRTTLIGSVYLDQQEDIKARVNYNDNPFELKTFALDSDIKVITAQMALIRSNCPPEIDPNTIRLSKVACVIEEFVPEAQSEEEIALRIFAMGKLSPQEKKILGLSHWDVYHKLGDRSMLDDEDRDDQG